jgi:hypothetical protein
MGMHLDLEEQHTLGVFEKRKMRGIFGYKEEEVTGG